MSVTSTRSLSDGSRATAWPMSRDVSTTFGAAFTNAGTVPFENFFLPRASIQVLHAEIAQSGFSEFTPDEAGDFTPDPDKRYKIRTYAGTITNSAGKRRIPDPDPLPEDYEVQYEFLAQDTTDDRVSTYTLAYSSTDTAEEPDGWTLTEEGTRETGDVYVYSTGPLSAEPDPNEAEGGTTSATSKSEVGTLSGEITCTLTEQVTLGDLTGYCEAKLSDLKDRVDDEPEEEEEPPPEEPEEGGEDEEDPGEPEPAPVMVESEVDSFQTDTLSLKLATVRMVWEGSGMFEILAGKLIYFSSTMQPSISLTTGTWDIAVSGEIPASEKFYDAMGMFGTSVWWDSDYSDFGSYVAGPLVTPNDGLYPGSGIPTGPLHKTARLRWFAADGLKRKIKVKHSPTFVGSPETGSYVYDTETLETSSTDGFSQATEWLDVEVVPVMDLYRIEESIRYDEDGTEVVEFGGSGEDADFDQSYWNLAIISQQREANRWGFIGFTGQMPIPPGGTPPELPDVRYSTVTLSSSSLKYSAREPSGTTPSGVGKTGTGDMSGSYTLQKPSDWAVGSLQAERRFTKTVSAKASPFKLSWVMGGHSGEKILKVIQENTNVPNIPFAGSGDSVTVTESHYQVTIPEQPVGSRPVREYRMRWDRTEKSSKPFPDQTVVTFTLPAPLPETNRQVSDWKDLPTPSAGTAFWTETTEDEFSCFVGS